MKERANEIARESDGVLQASYLAARYEWQLNRILTGSWDTGGEMIWEAWALAWAFSCMSVSFSYAEVQLAKGDNNHWFPRITGVLFALLSAYLITRMTAP